MTADEFKKAYEELEKALAVEKAKYAAAAAAGLVSMSGNPCPNCGYCQHCGRGGHYPAPYIAPYPYAQPHPSDPPYYPQWSSTITGVILDGGPTIAGVTSISGTVKIK